MGLVDVFWRNSVRHTQPNDTQREANSDLPSFTRPRSHQSYSQSTRIPLGIQPSRTWRDIPARHQCQSFHHPTSSSIIILFKSRVDVEKSWFEDGFTSPFGNLRLIYDVDEVYRGVAIPSKPDAWETNASLGLKLRFHYGREGIIVPTHAFVKFRHISHASPRG